MSHNAGPLGDAVKVSTSISGTPQRVGELDELFCSKGRVSTNSESYNIIDTHARTLEVLEKLGSIRPKSLSIKKRPRWEEPSSASTSYASDASFLKSDKRGNLILPMPSQGTEQNTRLELATL